MAYIGYRISPTDPSDGVPVAAGSDYNQVFTQTFKRIAPEISVGGWPSMQVLEVDITHEEADKLEKICSEHLD